MAGVATVRGPVDTAEPGPAQMHEQVFVLTALHPAHLVRRRAGATGSFAGQDPAPAPAQGQLDARATAQGDRAAAVK